MACVFPVQQVIVVGGGLAGVSACNTVVENGGKTVLIDKSSFCGGNSTKATSGINGAGTRTQKQQGIEDGADLFTKDTIKGGAKRPEIAKVLCENSGADVEWLMDSFDLDLSLVARLGGHSAPRTHRGKERFPGMTITYALIQMVEKVAEVTDKARIITKAKATTLLIGDINNVVGLIYEKAGQQFQEHGPVILCSGGFGADFSQDSLLAKYRPDLLHLPTTNGEHCTGDGIKMGEAIGAKTIDLEWVQVHPTGLVKPDDADAKIKFLAAEALRGVGGLILDRDGKRFANELGRRDYVTGEMWKNKAPFRLVLNKAASTEILWHCKHYTGRGVMKSYASGEELASDMKVPLSVLEETHQQHYEAAKKMEKDPDGGPYPAYPSGKSWDECSGKTGSGKKFYHNFIDGSAVKTEPFYVALITPVIHYCMGGLEVDALGQVQGKDGPIAGLYCAGEVAGGVHGNNRLGGNSLLDCVVFGRVTGVAATKYILGDDVTKVDLKVIAAIADDKMKAAEKAEEVKKAAEAGKSGAAAPASAAASSAPAKKAPPAPKKVEKAEPPAREKTYKPEAFKEHARGKFLSWWYRRQRKQRDVDYTLATAKALEEAFIPAEQPWMDREKTVVDMAYFPMPGSHEGLGAHAVIPFFTESGAPAWKQTLDMTKSCWAGCGENTQRKITFSCALSGLLMTSMFIIHNTGCHGCWL
jgi:flavocytochrome c